MLIHHHFIYQAEVNNTSFTPESKEVLVQFLHDIVNLIEMEILIAPQVVLSIHNAWTGLVGIVTSHISFHYWMTEQYVQLDVYSCKAFDKELLAQYLDSFWQASNRKAIFIQRGLTENFNIVSINL